MVGVAGLGTADGPDRSSGASAEQVDASTAARIVADEEVQLVSLPERVALAHDASSIDAVSPRGFKAGSFLKAIIENDRVPHNQRARARKELTRRQPSPQSLCFCSRGNRQTETAILESLEALREKAFGYDDDIDIALATVVSDLAGADRTVHQPDLTKKTRETWDAILAPEPPEREPEADSTLVPFWDVVLSPDPGIDAKPRLDAYAVLDGAGAIPRCMCPAPGWQLWEDRRDDLRAYVVWTIARDSEARWGQTAFPHAYRVVHSLLQLRSREQPADASADDARPGQRKRRNDTRGEHHGTAPRRRRSAAKVSPERQANAAPAAGGGDSGTTWAREGEGVAPPDGLKG